MRLHKGKPRRSKYIADALIGTNEKAPAMAATASRLFSKAVYKTTAILSRRPPRNSARVSGWVLNTQGAVVV